MNTKNLIYASLIGGAVIAVLSNIPILNLINCILCAGVWGGAILAAYFFKRFEGRITVGQGAAVGALSGLWAGILGLLLSLVALSGVAAVLATARTALPPDMQDILAPASLGAFSIFVNFVQILITVFFGTVGGLIGGAIFQSGSAPAYTPPPTGSVPPPSPAYVAPQVPQESFNEPMEAIQPESPEEEISSEEAPGDEPPAT